MSLDTFNFVRTFHPIGQGAFYSEEHEGFTIVYDCGSHPLSNSTKELVEGAFGQGSKEKTIDILFISHFDYDHVSAISTLKSSVKEIKAVVMPLLHDNQKNLLINVNQNIPDDSNDLTNLIKDPKQFFRNETDIFYVHPVSLGEDLNKNDTPLTLDEIKNSTVNAIKSGQKITSKACKKWVFVPFNIEDKNRTSDFLGQLEKKEFDKNKLQSNPNYVIQNTTMKDSRQKLRQAYKNVDGTVNENSLLLYSGPEKANDSVCTLDKAINLISTPPGCIYTGDCNLKKLHLHSIYEDYLNSVGTIQVPHHGSKHNFDIKQLSHFKNIKWLPVSFGTKNNYGHPHDEVRSEINSIHSYNLKEITELKGWEEKSTYGVTPQI